MTSCKIVLVQRSRNHAPSCRCRRFLFRLCLGMSAISAQLQAVSIGQRGSVAERVADLNRAVWLSFGKIF